MPALSDQLVLKEGGVFLITDQAGDVKGESGLGLYFQDMRHLSRFSLDLGEHAPELLNYSSSLNFLDTLQFANRIFNLADGTLVLPQTISLSRVRFISDGLHERFSLVSYNPFAVPITVTLTLGADFRDIFDVRGFARSEWGEHLRPEYRDGVLMLGYQGLDGIEYCTHVTFDRQPESTRVVMPESTAPVFENSIVMPTVAEPSLQVHLPIPLAELTWNFVLQPNEPITLSTHIVPVVGGDSTAIQEEESIAPTVKVEGRFERALGEMRTSYEHWDAEGTTVHTDHEDFNRLLERSKADLRVLCQAEGDGYFPAAGIPWYTCPFGRDSIITALQTLMLNPKIAVGTLRTLARWQGEKEDPWREEQPGKILHELRRGEMAHLNMVPHSPYFGTVDATPLFIVLFVEMMRWLDDDALYEELLPNVRRALEWIDTYGDVDGDGFVEYVAATHANGIRNQVWKDSNDSYQFPDRKLAETPLAAVEVQGYVYAAKSGLAALLRRKGDVKWADKLVGEAETLKRRFNEAFWMPEAGFFAEGLDRDKRQIPTITSNPGHALWSGIADEEKARQTVQRLMKTDMLSGWGIRTISDESTTYNPMSYHNGSIWPHDNSLVIAGFKRYGFHEEANRAISEIMAAAKYFQNSRLPELYCGFPRDRVYGSGPAEYPVSCSPQAWAAAAPILMLQAILGLQVEASTGAAQTDAWLPEWLNRIELRNLQVGGKTVSILVEKTTGEHKVTITADYGGIEIDQRPALSAQPALR